MTRINTIDPQDLLDQHLFIEYREITRVATLHRAPKPGEVMPQTYTLGTGHVKFFYDKGEFLAKRCEALHAELVSRGYNVTKKHYKQHIAGCRNDWTPTASDIIVNLSRLQTKLLDKPMFYTYRGRVVAPNYYLSLAKYGSN